MKRSIIVLSLIALLAAACAPLLRMSAPKSDFAGVGGGSDDRSVQFLAPMEAPAMQESVAVEAYNAESAGNAVQERMIRQNVNLTIVVPDPEQKMEAIIRLATQMGGFLVSSNIYQTYAPNGKQVPEAYVTVRVPTERLNTALEQIKADVVEVRNENRTGEDVTQEYVDNRSRLRSLETAEEQLVEIMQAATDTQDVLDVFNQLEYYREQIEMVKGQIQYLEQSTDTASISVTIVAEETIQPLEIGGWKPEGVVRDAVQTLINFLQGFVDFLIWLVMFILPVAIVILLPIFLIALGIRAIVRRSRVKKTPPKA